MGLVQSAIKGYWRHFRFFSCRFCVTNLPIPRFFWRGPVFVLLMIHFFRHSTSYFLGSDKFENAFGIVVKAVSALE